MDVKCNSCTKDFKIEIKKRAAVNDVIDLYFICPHCHAEYFAYRTTDEIERMQQKISYHAEKISKCKDPKKRLEISEKMHDLIEKKKVAMEELNK